MERTGVPKHPIGLKEVDEVLWGVHKRELLTLAARTSQGKSAFSIHLAKTLVERSNRVLYFSLEMSKEQILERLVTNIALINNLALRRGDEMAKAAHAPLLGKLPIDPELAKLCDEGNIERYDSEIMPHLGESLSQTTSAKTKP